MWELAHVGISQVDVTEVSWDKRSGVISDRSQGSQSKGELQKVEED